MKSLISLNLLLVLFCSFSFVSNAQEKYSTVESARDFLNELYQKNEHAEKYKIVSVGDDLIEFTTTSLRSKEVVESLEKDGKTLDEFPATKVLQRNDDGSVLVESKSAMVISTMKKFPVQIEQSQPYTDVHLIYFQNVLMLTWDNINSKWALSTWNYSSFSFKGPDILHEEAFAAWEFLLEKVVQREDLIKAK